MISKNYSDFLVDTNDIKQEMVVRFLKIKTDYIFVLPIVHTLKENCQMF